MAMELFDLSLQDVRIAHATAGVMATSQTAAHIGIELKKAQIQLSQRVDLYGLLVRPMYEPLSI